MTDTNNKKNVLHHKMRSLLTAIIGYTDLISKEVAKGSNVDTAKVSQWLDLLRKSVSSITILLDEGESAEEKSQR